MLSVLYVCIHVCLFVFKTRSAWVLKCPNMECTNTPRLKEHCTIYTKAQINIKKSPSVKL